MASHFSGDGNVVLEKLRVDVEDDVDVVLVVHDAFEERVRKKSCCKPEPRDRTHAIQPGSRILSNSAPLSVQRF